MDLWILEVIPDIWKKDHHHLLLAPRSRFGMGQSPQQDPFEALLHLHQIVCANLFLLQCQ